METDDGKEFTNKIFNDLNSTTSTCTVDTPLKEQCLLNDLTEQSPISSKKQSSEKETDR